MTAALVYTIFGSSYLHWSYYHRIYSYIYRLPLATSPWLSKPPVDVFLPSTVRPRNRDGADTEKRQSPTSGCERVHRSKGGLSRREALFTSARFRYKQHEVTKPDALLNVEQLGRHENEWRTYGYFRPCPSRSSRIPISCSLNFCIFPEAVFG